MHYFWNEHVYLIWNTLLYISALGSKSFQTEIQVKIIIFGDFYSAFILEVVLKSEFTTVMLICLFS